MTPFFEKTKAAILRLPDSISRWVRELFHGPGAPGAGPREPMYFWRLEGLKTRMLARPGQVYRDREALPYVLAWAVAIMVFFNHAFPGLAEKSYSGIDTAKSALFALAGVLYPYWKNGGGEGRDFLTRYVVLGWVISVRWAVGFTIALFFVFFALTLAGVEDLFASGWARFAADLATAALIWRLGHHMGNYATRASAIEKPH